MPEAPRSAARSISPTRSLKSPWPQLRRRADAVKLHGQRPHPPWRGCVALIGPIRTNDQAMLLDERPAAVVPSPADGTGQWAARRQRQRGRYAFSFGDVLLPAISHRSGSPPPRQRLTARSPARGQRWSAAASAPRGIIATRARAEQSDQHLRLDRPQTPEAVSIFRLDAPTRCAFKNRIHRGRSSEGPTCCGAKFRPRSTDNGLVPGLQSVEPAAPSMRFVHKAAWNCPAARNQSPGAIGSIPCMSPSAVPAA